MLSIPESYLRTMVSVAFMRRGLPDLNFGDPVIEVQNTFQSPSCGEAFLTVTDSASQLSALEFQSPSCGEAFLTSFV